MGFGAYLKKVGNIYVLSFRGTNPEQLIDWITNISQGLGYRNSQYRQAAEVALYVQSKVGSNNLLITGHSLGGGLASYAASLTGSRAITFNAAGLHPFVGSRSGNIRAHYIRGDVLSFGQDLLQIAPTAVGTRIFHNPSQIRTPFGYHLMDNFNGL